MAPILPPPSFPASRRLGRSAADAITISSSSSSDQSAAASGTLLVVSSDVSFHSVDSSSTSGSSEATSRSRSRRAPRHRRPRSPARSVAVSGRSPLVAPAPSANGATRRPERKAPPHRRPRSPAPSAAVSDRSPAVARAPSSNEATRRLKRKAAVPDGSPVEATSRRPKAKTPPRRRPRSQSQATSSVSASVSMRASDDGGDEATSCYAYAINHRIWGFDNELRILIASARLRRKNFGVCADPSVVLEELRKDPEFCRSGVDAPALSQKLFQLKNKFKRAVAANKYAANSSSLRKYRRRCRAQNDRLYEESMKVWPELLQVGDASGREPSSSTTRASSISS